MWRNKRKLKKIGKKSLTSTLNPMCNELERHQSEDKGIQDLIKKRRNLMELNVDGYWTRKGHDGKCRILVPEVIPEQLIRHYQFYGHVGLKKLFGF